MSTINEMIVKAIRDAAIHNPDVQLSFEKFCNSPASIERAS
jgi:hypothetical protein